jgi:hypothetical protein
MEKLFSVYGEKWKYACSYARGQDHEQYPESVLKMHRISKLEILR